MRKSGKPKLDLLDLPTYARNDLGLHGLNLSSELLAGVNRERLEKLRERADKAGCACLLLSMSDPCAASRSAAASRTATGAWGS